MIVPAARKLTEQLAAPMILETHVNNILNLYKMIIEVSEVNKDFYAILCSASPVKKSRGDNPFLTLLNKMILKSRPNFQEFYLSDYTKKYINDLSEMHCYLVSKVSEEIVGHVMGTSSLIVGKDEININQVEVSLKHRNKGVCSKLLVPTFVKLTGTRRTYMLLNTGGDSSCKCYQTAFGKLGYVFQSNCPASMIFTLNCRVTG